MAIIQGTKLNDVTHINEVPIAQLGGSGEGGNYITTGRTGNSTADITSPIWQSYVSTPAGANPGTSIAYGSGALAVALNTSTPISGNGDIRFTKDAVNRQGHGRLIRFTVENRHLARVMQVSCEARLLAGSTYTNPSPGVNADLRLSIIQSPDSSPVIIEPVNTQIQLGTPGTTVKLIATFQTDISQRNYALAVHVAGTGINAFTVDFNNFRVWEPQQNYGAIITDWQEYTPNFSAGFGTISDRNIQWRRVGSNCEIRGRFTTASVPSSTQTFTLPSGLVTNVNYITAAVGVAVGQIFQSSFSENTASVLLARNDNLIYIGGLIGNTSSTNNPLSTSGANVLGNAVQNFFLSVPIQGWGSTLALSSDAGDGRVVAASYGGFISQSYTNSQPLRWDTRIYDTHNAVTTGSGWRFTAPISGFYRLSATYVYSGDASNIAVELWVDGVLSHRLQDVNFAVGYVMTEQVRLNAGQYLELRTVSTRTMQSSGRFSIERISTGSQIIASGEDVNFALEFSGGNISWSNPFNSAIKIFDSHNIFNTSNGTFTVPMSGKYILSVTAGLTTAFAAAFWGLRLLNGVTIVREGYCGGNSTTAPFGNITFPFSANAGDVMTIRPESGGSTFDTPTSPRRNTILMYRIGN